MRKLNHFIQLLAMAALVLLGHPDTALAQLVFTPTNFVSLSIGGPGQTASATLSVTSSSNAAATNVGFNNIVTQDGTNWLCPSVSGNQITVSIGSGCGSSTTQLLPNTTYDGHFNVQADQGTSSVTVSVQVGGSGTTTNGLTTIPSTLIFTQSVAGQSVGSQTANAYYNGGVTNITNVSFSPISGPNGAIAFASCFPSGSAVTCNLTGSATTQGTYTGTATISTATGGTIGLPVTLTIGSGSSSFGLSVNQNPVTLTASSVGAAVNTQFVTLSYNGQPVTPTSVNYTTSSGGSWLQAYVSGTQVAVAASSFNLGIGTYSGTVTVNSSVYGSTNFQVNLDIGTGGTTGFGLSVTPNPVTLFAASTGAAVTTQYATVLYSGGQVTPTSVSYTTSTGGSWLQAYVSGSSVAVSGFSSGLGVGTYSGTVTVNTTQYGSTSFQVTLNVGTSGGTSGLTVSPNPVTLTASTTGAAVATQYATVLYNGAQATPSSVSYTTSTGGSWLQAYASGNSVAVTAFSSSLGIGTYTGTVTVTTTQYGSTSFQVTLNVGTSGTSGLTATPNPVTLYAANVGGGVNPQTVTILYNGSQVTPTSVTYSTATGASWLSPSIVGNTVQVGAQTSFVGIGSYTGTVTVNTLYGPTTFQVTLNVGTGGNSLGLASNPSSASFTIPYGGGTPAQNLSVTYNGLPVTISSVTSSTTSSQDWLIASPTSTGVMLSINGAALLQGTYQATVSVVTLSGTLVIPVTLTVGVGGSSTSGLAATPNPVSLSTVQVGGVVSSQTVTITYNGSPVTVSNVSSSTSTGQSWLVPTVLGGDLVSVGANTSFLSGGTYSGTVNVTTNYGTTSFLVNLTIGATGTTGLSATPNPVTLTAATAGATVISQIVSINYNGSPASVTGISTATSTNQNWLVASSNGTTVNVTANTASLATGVYTGTVTVSTTLGSTTFQVNLTVGTGGTTSSALAANPNPVVFTEAAAGQGGTQTITETYNGATIPITNATFAPSDLFTTFVNVQVNPNGTVTLTLNNIATNPGTYTGTVLLYSTYGNLNVPVTLQIGGGGLSGLIATPNPVTFNVAVGGTAASQTVNITDNGGAVGVTAVNATTTTGQTWLIPSVGNSAVNVGINPAGLLTGTYTGTVNVTTTLGLVTIQVNLSVGGSGVTTTGTGLQLGASALSFAYEIGQVAPPSQVVSVASSAGQYFFNATPQAGTFLVVSGGSGNTPGSFTVGVNAVGLTAGTYTGSISVTSSASSTPQTIPVTLVVSSTSLIQVSQSSITLTAPLGSAQPLTQTIQVNSTDTQTIGFTAAASSTSNWLSVTASTPTSPSTITITANPAGLAQGTYTGTVTLTASSPTIVANSPFTIPVTLIVGSGVGTGTGTGGLVAQPASLTFAQATNGSIPATQVISVSGPSGVTYSAVASLPSGQNWLTVSPSNFALPATLTVSVNGSTLPVGTYSGSIVVSSFGTGSSQTIPVTLTVGTSAIVPSLVVSPTSLTPISFSGGAAPATQNIQVSLSNGNPVPFTAAATTASGGSWLSVTPTSGTTPAPVSVLVNPLGIPAGTYTGTVTITINGAAGSPLSLPITLTITAPTGPTVTAVENAASGVPTSLSPGLNITIFGSNMGPASLATLQLSASGNVATSLSGTQVTFDGIPAPIVYTKSSQVSVMVPYEIAGKTSTSMVVSYNGASSTPLPINVVSAAPGIYTLNQSGTGQGAILNQNGTVNGPQNPEIAGDIVSIFMTGEGQTTPGGVDGALTPGRLPVPTPVGAVAVTIGGMPVSSSNITFAGEAPTLISGVMQVNVRIPANAGTGAIPIVVSVGGINSQANTTVSLR